MRKDGMKLDCQEDARSINHSSGDHFSEADMTGTYNHTAWVATGTRENWERALENGIWGIDPALHRNWKVASSGDLLLFYAKRPVSRFFGAGIIRAKFRQTSPLWKEEIEQRRVIWPFRLELDVIVLLPFNSWKDDGVVNDDYKLSIHGGLNPVKDFPRAMEVLQRMKQGVHQDLQPDLQKISESIYEIGRIQRMIVETNYPVDGQPIDVIWKRTVRSVPTFAFKVSLEEDVEPPIRTLKHAYDMWNSRPFLVTREEKVDEVMAITSGLYHEFESALKVLSDSQITELHASKKKYYSLEERYGPVSYTHLTLPTN